MDTSEPSGIAGGDGTTGVKNERVGWQSLEHASSIGPTESDDPAFDDPAFDDPVFDDPAFDDAGSDEFGSDGFGFDDFGSGPSADRSPQPELAEDDEEPLEAPSVVVVVVTHRPGDWLEPCLESLVAQDYPNLSTLIVDAGSPVDPTARIAKVAPAAFLRRLGRNPGFGTAVNVATKMVEGAAFYLICHDDVALSPTTVRLLVEEAYRSNAGIVGPKLVDWNDTDRLQDVGLGSDKFAVPASLVEPGELDQEQHDGVRDVFTVPSACLLVRADLLNALGGFDEAIPFCGDDVDLCWRAHLAGARVLVVPAARARHVAAWDSRAPGNRAQLSGRHQLRTVLGSYGAFYLAAIVPQQLLVSLIEFVVALLTGRFRKAANIVGGYVWNLTRVKSLLAKRRRVARLRQVTDLELRRLQVRGSARFGAYVRSKVDSSTPNRRTLVRSGRRLVRSVRGGSKQQNIAVALGAALVSIFGLRHLLSQSIALFGEFSTIGSAGHWLIRDWWSGWRSAGLGAASSVPFGSALLGSLSLLLIGATSLARTLAIAGLIPIGAFGAWRMARPYGVTSRAPAASMIAYVANPLPYNALVNGSWRGLAAYAALPWIIRRLALATGQEPFVLPEASTTRSRLRLAREVLVFGLVVALFGTVYSAAPVVALVVLIGLSLGSAAAGQWAGMGRMALVAVGGSVVAVVLHAPSLIGGLDNNDAELSLAGRAGETGDFSLADSLRFATGPHGRSLLVWGLFAAGLFALIIGRKWRLAWATRGWLLALLPWALLALQRSGTITVALPPAEVLLAPAAAGLALAIGMGVAAFEADLPGYGFGWRQFATALASLGLVLAALPMLFGSWDGRWKMPRGGWDRGMHALISADKPLGPFRVLWIGDRSIVPAAGFDMPGVDGALTFATTVGLPGVDSVWAAPEQAAVRLIPEALAAAASGDSSRLGADLAPMGVRYIILVDEAVPRPFGTVRKPVPSSVKNAFASQLDLAELQLNSAAVVYRNDAWIPFAAEVATRPAGDLRALDPAAAKPLQAIGQRVYRGDATARSTIHVAEAFSPNWQATVNGKVLAHDIGFGWANRFTVDEGGTVTVRYNTPNRRRLINLAQLSAWSAVLATLFWTRRRKPQFALTEQNQVHTVDGGDDDSLVTAGDRVLAGAAPASPGSGRSEATS